MHETGCEKDADGKIKTMGTRFRFIENRKTLVYDEGKSCTHRRGKCAPTSSFYKSGGDVFTAIGPCFGWDCQMKLRLRTEHHLDKYRYSAFNELTFVSRLYLYCMSRIEGHENKWGSNEYASDENTSRKIVFECLDIGSLPPSYSKSNCGTLDFIVNTKKENFTAKVCFGGQFTSDKELCDKLARKVDLDKEQVKVEGMESWPKDVVFFFGARIHHPQISFHLVDDGPFSLKYLCTRLSPSYSLYYLCF